MSAATCPTPFAGSTARRMLYFATDGSPPRLVDAMCKPDGAAVINCFARVTAPDLDAVFSKPHLPARVKIQVIALRSLPAQDAPPDYFHLFYSVSPSLTPNGFALQVLEMHHPENRIFWRGDMLLARWINRETGYGHIDVPEMERLVHAVERVILHAFTDRRLETYLEEDRSWLSTTPLRLVRYQTLRDEIRELDAYRTHRVLLLPANGSDPRHLPLVFSEEGARAIQSYLYRAPDLWQVFGPGIAKTRMQILVVPANSPHLPLGFNVEYHIFYNLSPTLPANSNALRIVTGFDELPAGRLVWRGDLVVARVEGSSGYADVSAEALPFIENGLRNLWESQALEASIQADRDFLAEHPGSELPRHVALREQLDEIDASFGK